MKADEEMGPDRGMAFETDDEDNLADHHYGSHASSISSDTSSSSSDDNHIGGDPSSYQTTWPVSYRQSIDVFSSVPSPKVGFLAASSLVEKGSSFLRAEGSFLRPGASMLSNHDQEAAAHHLVKPLIHPYPSFTAPDHGSVVLPSDGAQRGSFAFSSYVELPPPRQCSTAQAVINGLNVLCGVGILSIPYAVKEGGWAGMLFLLGVGSISFYTGMLLKRCLDSLPGLKTYPDIGQAAFGVSGRLFISIVLYLELYGCCVEYITLVGDNLASIFPDASLNFLGAELSSPQLFAVTTALAVLPTVWLKNLSLLSYLSAGGVLATLLVVLCLFWVGVVDQVGFHPGGSALNLMDLPVALGLYGFCYSGHSVFPNIYSSMEMPSQFPFVLMICFVACTILYAGVAAAGYLMFGDALKSQFTLNMPHQYLISKVAVWTTVVNPLSKYALTMTPVALSIEELLPSTSQSNFVMLSMRTFLVFSTLVVALTVPFFASVMALLGSVFTMLVVLWCFLVIIIGVVCSLVGSYSSIKQMIDQKKN